MSDGSGKAPWFPRAATALAVLSCYGTTVLIGLLSLLGVTLAIDESVWAGAIAFFAALATAAIAMSYRRHRIVGPTVVAALGLGLILWAMFGSYSRVVELVGFVLLIAAALWDWRAGISRGALAVGVSWIEASALADHLKSDPPPVIVDVRGPDEFTGPLGHIVDASNIPVDELPNRLMEINALKDKPVILVCRTDKRSAKGAALLRDAGFRNLRVLRGGMERWKMQVWRKQNREEDDMKTKRILLAAVMAGGIAVTAVGTAVAQGMQGDMAPGMMQGNTSPGMMGPCMGQGSMGQGMMGPGMMGPGMMQGGMGQGTMGPGMMAPGMMPGGTGAGTGAPFGSRVTPMMNLSVEDVRGYLALQLERLNNKRLKVGDVSADDAAITANIVTVDNSLVQQLKVDRRTGAIEYQN